MKRAVISLLAVMVFCLSAFGAAYTEETAKSRSLLNKGKYIPDIATFMQVGACSPAGYTWDGKTVFFRSSMSGASQIYRLLEEGWPYQLTTFEDGVDFFSLNWGGDMAVVGASIGGSEQSQLFLMDTETGRIHQLTDAHEVQYGSVVWAKDDQSIFLRSNEENGRDFFIYRMNMSTGKKTKVFGDTASVRGYNYIADLSQDGSQMIIANYTSNVNNDLYLLDLGTGGFQKLNDDDGDVIYGSPTLMPDRRTIWLSCNDNDDGITRICKMRVGSSEIEWVKDGWVDPKWEVDGLSFSRDYKYMTAFYNENGYVRMKSREVESKSELPTPPLDGILGGGQFASDGSCLISFTGPTRAPDVWRWHPESGELTQLTHSIYAGINREIFQEPGLVHYKSFDGLEIPAFMYLPPNYREGEAIPFIVHAHGGPESQYQPYFIRNIQYLLLNGYGVLAPNVRGSSGYGRDYLNLDNYKNRRHSLQDYRAAVDYLLNNGYTKKGAIGIRGDAAVDVVGIANFKTFLENTKAYRRALRESEYGPLSDPEFLAEVSPIHKANLIKTPLLVIHGENDPRVPVGEARQIIQAVQDNGGIVDSLIFPDEGHGASKRVNIIAEYRKQVEFFDRHLKPRIRETEATE
jgi:dipeptidyl aminopeptidase/acylaminoacyl peptidase